MSKRLLLADDSITIQKVIGITFANEDYQLDIVDNGTSALEHARAHRPDVVLADVYMPGRNGYELCTAIKQDPQLQGVPVLLLAGTFEPFDEDKASQAGADGWIAKPFESQALIDRVEELIQSAAQPQPTPEPEPAVLATAAEADAPPVMPETAAAEEDLWAEPEALGGEEEIDLVEDLEPLGEASEGTADDVWGSISFDEEDLVGDAAEEIVPPAAPSRTEPRPVAVAAPAPPAEEVWDEENDEIFDLEDEDIIDEADLLEDFDEPLEAPVAVDVAAEEEFAIELEEPVVAEEPSVAPVESSAGRGVPAPAWVEEYAFEPEAGGAEFDLEPAEAELELAAPEFEEPPVELAAAEPEPVREPVAEPTVTPSAVPAAPAVSPTVTLDDAEVEKIVARVAEEVVERLAGTLLEKIAWEVVPDLAEGMIKDEIRRIKATMQ